MRTNDASGQDAPLALAITREFEGAELGDQRRSGRLVKFVEAMAREPGASIPKAMACRAEEDAAYRFLSNEAVTKDAILQPHVEQTVRRMAEARVVVVAHDTTELEFGGASKREGMGRLGGSRRQGFFAHCSLAVTADATRCPLGLVGLYTWARTSSRRSSKTEDGRRCSGPDYAKRVTKESQRWWNQVQKTEEQVCSRAQIIHVMDREADAFPLLASMSTHAVRFVVRLARDRIARAGDDAPNDKLRHLVAQAEEVFTLQVPVTERRAKRAPRANETSGARAWRLARVGFRAAKTELRRPSYVTVGPAWLPVHLVEVYEIDPPSGVKPIEWMLVTSEPIKTAADIFTVVEYYRTRWLIEEYFKALKTGCAIEKRQLESYEAMTNLLAILLLSRGKCCCSATWREATPRRLPRWR